MVPFSSFNEERLSQVAAKVGNAASSKDRVRVRNSELLLLGRV
jgi:hypothetical protein